MNNFSIKIKLLRPNAKIPEYATDGAAAADLCAALDEPVVLNPSERRLIPTGIAIAPDEPPHGDNFATNDRMSGKSPASGADIDSQLYAPATHGSPSDVNAAHNSPPDVNAAADSPSGASFAAVICARSGLATRSGLALANGIGVVDADYRGEIMVSMINLGNEPVTIEPGERIAQLMFVPVLHAEFIQSEVLPETARQAGGFGSTGTK